MLICDLWFSWSDMRWFKHYIMLICGFQADRLLCVQSQRNRLSLSVCTVSAAYSDGGVIIAKW